MKPAFFVRGDIDGFFGLFIDNLLQLMLIVVLCQQVCSFPAELVTGIILPGACISILMGNLFYSYQAWQLMKKTGRTDVTTLTYGIIYALSALFLLFLHLSGRSSPAS